MQKIGFVGLGAMGAAMAQQLVAKQYKVTGYDLNAAAVEALAAAGGHAAASVAQAAAGAETLIVMVVNADQAENVLVEAARVIRQGLREMDVAARYGGEEFALILPDTSREGAEIVAERVRKELAGRSEFAPAPMRITTSAGVASFPVDASGADELIQRADEALYRAKVEGKNRVVLGSGDRRGSARVPVGRAVMIDDDAGDRTEGRAMNASTNGVLVSLPSPLPVGSKLRLLVNEEDRSELSGEVVRLEPGPDARYYDVGIRLEGDRKGTALLMPPVET